MSTDILTPAPKTGSLALLKERASAIKLTEPGPSREQIAEILEAAVTVADHGRIRPWRFVVIEGDARQHFGDLMVEAKRVSTPDLADAEAEKIRSKALRAPVLIVLLCEADPAQRVPVVEQQWAVAAAGAHLMLAAKALGFGANWKTGSLAYEPLLRDRLGFGETASVIGFFYIGTEPKASPLPRATIESVVRYWPD